MGDYELTEEQKLENTKRVLAELNKLAESQYDRNMPSEPMEERAVPDERTLLSELSDVFNRYSLDSTYNIPDYMLAEYTLLALQNLNGTVRNVRRWHTTGVIDKMDVVEERSN